MVKTPGGYFTNTEIEQVFKHIVEGEIITINKYIYISAQAHDAKGEIFNPYILFRSFLSALNLMNIPKASIVKCQCWSNKGKCWFLGNLEIVKLYLPSVCVSCLCAQRHKKYTRLSVFLYGPVVTELKVDHDTVTRIVLLVCEGLWRGSQNSEVVKTSFAVFSDILCTIGKKT